MTPAPSAKGAAARGRVRVAAAAAGRARRRPHQGEDDFQAAIVDLAVHLGWKWVHWRSVTVTRRRRGGPPVTYNETPYDGPLGPGWPDLTFLRERLVTAEVKGDGGRLSDDQRARAADLAAAGVEHYTWGPRDWDQVVAVLSRRDR